MVRIAGPWQAVVVKMEYDLGKLKKLNLPMHVEAMNARVTALEAMTLTLNQKENISEKQTFWRKVLESKTILDM